MRISENELLQELINGLPPQLQPDEVTAGMVSKSTGYSIQGARTYLDRLVKDGSLEKHDAVSEGKIVKAYRKKG